MNIWQACRQVQFLLRARLWDGTGSVVFHSTSVVVTDVPEANALLTMIQPSVLISPAEGSPDAEEPRFGQESIELKLTQVVAGDHVGENAIMGSVRATTGSVGRGVLEVAEQIFEALDSMSSDLGLAVSIRPSSIARTTLVEEKMWAFRQYTLELWLTSFRTYFLPTDFVGAVSAPNVNMTWTLPPARFDRFRMILRRVAGGNPTTDPTAGTGIALSGDLATSISDTPGSGTFSYSLFTSYDETNPTPSADQRFSAADTITVTVP